MSEHCSIASRFVASVVSRRRRWLTAAIGAFGVSGLVLGGLAAPASAESLPNNVTLEQWADVGSSWITGALGLEGVGASTYEEGETVPFRLDVTSAGAGTFAFSVCRDYSNGDVRGYLSLAPYDTSFPGLTGLLSGVETDPADGPDQPFAGAALVGSVQIDSVHEVGGPGTCGAGLRETEVQITITAGPAGALAGAYVLWGGRLASPADAEVGPGNGASQFPGGSLSMRLGGVAKNLSIKTAAIIQLATITVEKHVDSGDAAPSAFCFTINPDSHDVGAQCPPAGGSTVSFVGLASGNYSIREVGVAGYTFASGAGTANCLFSNGVATANVAVGNTPNNATCEFHNRRLSGTLTVNQVVDPSEAPGRFNLQIDGTTAGTGANVGDGGTTGPTVVAAGVHTVGQTAMPGTDLGDYTASLSCTAGGSVVASSNGEITVADGQDVVCTITLNLEPLIIIDPLPSSTTTTTSTTTETTATTSGTTDTTSGTTPTTSGTTGTTSGTTGTTLSTTDTTSGATGTTSGTTATTSGTTDTTSGTTGTTSGTADTTSSTTDTTSGTTGTTSGTTGTTSGTTDTTSGTTGTTSGTTGTTSGTTDTTSGTTATTSGTTNATVEPNTATTQATTTTTGTPDRCASSRGVKPQCDGGSDVDVDSAVEEQPDTPVPSSDPAVDPGTTVAGDGNHGAPAPVDEVLSGQLERPAPAPAPEVGPMPAAATLPRTGSGVGDEATLGAGLLAAGIALLRVSRRRRPSAPAHAQAS